MTKCQTLLSSVGPFSLLVLGLFQIDILSPFKTIMKQINLWQVVTMSSGWTASQLCTFKFKCCMNFFFLNFLIKLLLTKLIISCNAKHSTGHASHDHLQWFCMQGPHELAFFKNLSVVSSSCCFDNS